MFHRDTEAGCRIKGHWKKAEDSKYVMVVYCLIEIQKMNSDKQYPRDTAQNREKTSKSKGRDQELTKKHKDK
jgi:hypothetical protein